MANKQFLAAHEETTFIMLAVASLTVYFIISTFQQKLYDKYGEKVLTIKHFSVIFALLMLLAFIIYFNYFFQPEAVSLQVSEFAKTANPDYFLNQLT